MPRSSMPSDTLPMLILRVLRSGSLHGYAIAQRMHLLSTEVLQVEEGVLYPALQKMLLKDGSVQSGALRRQTARFASTPSPLPVANSSRQSSPATNV